MTPLSLLSALLLVGGGLVVLLRSQLRRPDLRLRLRAVDGVPPPSRGVVVGAVAAAALLVAVPALPVVLAVVGVPPVAVLVAALAVAPVVATTGAELYASLRRSGLPRRMPLTAQWQRRLVGALVARASAPVPAPPLRQRKLRRRSGRPTLTSAGTGRRLLVLPPGTPPMRLWDVAESYLGARSRYRDILSLNRARRSPGGAVVTEDSKVAAGWTLLMPRDATGAGLVDLPGDPRLPMQPGPAERGFGGVAGASVVLTEPEPVPEPQLEDDIVTVEDAPGTEPAPPDDPGSFEHPAADLPWDLVHARLLAEGVRAMLVHRRGEREHRRPVGAGVRPLDPAAAVVDTAAEIGADRAGADAVDRAVRLLPSPPPPVVAARLLDGVVEFVLAAPSPAPAPFTADPQGLRWSVRRDAASGGGASRLPGLVSLGRDRAGWTMLDLGAAGTTVITGEERAARMVATAIGLELLTSRWADGARVAMVGFGRVFAGIDPRLTVADRLDQVIDDVVRCAGEATSAQFVVLAAPPAGPAAEQLRELAAPGSGTRVGMLVVGGPGDGRRVLDLGADGVLTCAELGIAVGAQALSGVSADAVTRLVVAETGFVPPDALGRGARLPELPHEVDPDATGTVVRLFGEPRLDGPGGPIAADPLTVEIVAFLALHGTAAPREIAQGVQPFGVPAADLGTAVKVVAEVLGTAASGPSGLLEYDDGRWGLTPDVQADWHLFVRLAAGGRAPDALALLGHAGPARGPRYSWLNSVPLSRTLPGFVADIAHDQVLRRLAERRADLATAAAAAALRVLPFSAVLREDLQRAAAAGAAPGPGRPGPGA